MAGAPAVFLHRRDLRIDDNRGLAAACAAHDVVYGCFVLDPAQLGPTNPYRSDKQVRFMRECLHDLTQQYAAHGAELQLLSGDAVEEAIAFARAVGARAIFTNADYTPYAQARDARLVDAAAASGIAVTVLHDALLIGDPAGISTAAGGPVTIFTPFWKRATLVSVPEPIKLSPGKLARGPVPGVSVGKLESLAPEIEPATLAVAAGRTGGKAILERAVAFSAYDQARDLLALPTTRLSAHHKFGTVSIRETYHAFGRTIGYDHALIRQLYWRDFYTYFLARVPRTLEESYDSRHEILYAEPDPALIAAWTEGRTGFPVVDAAMRELAATGYMHNRARLIAGSFLTKDLHQPWWVGEAHFARSLIDYDPAVNNGNWQWVGGTGADPVPYFRIFNPWLQAKKFDPDASYIKRWVPELAELDAAAIHALEQRPAPAATGYPRPIVDHAEAVRHIKALYARPGE